MNDEEMIETLKLFDEERVENLPKKSQKLFYAIMKIADERDDFKAKIDNTIGLVKSLIVFWKKYTPDNTIEIGQLENILHNLQGSD